MIAQKKVNIHYPNQDFGEIEDEYWKTVILHGVPVEKYIVSNYGNVIGPQNKKLRWKKNGGSRCQYPGVALSCDRTLFENRGFVPSSSHYKNAVTYTVNVHILVANAFLPLDDNIPEELDEYVEIDGKTRQIWSMLPDHTKLWIRSLLNVDHIDNDKSNPHVSNLTFVSPRKNNSHVKKQALEGSC